MDLDVFRFTFEEELTLLGRLLAAALVGGIVGWERRDSGHQAGVRTLALVSMGAAAFALVSLLGFGANADTARVAAQVASGVGFIGAGTILVRGATVQGLTTAAAIWLSAALGLAAGTGMLLLALGGAVLATVILRIGPRPGTVEGEDEPGG
jgi:putative Mg2+ transporter-C (MgtC) family protein